MPEASTPDDSAILHERVLLFTKVLFLINVGFSALGLVLSALVPATGSALALLDHRVVGAFRLASLVLMGGAWWYCAHRHPSRLVLRAIESGGSLLLVWLMLGMVRRLPEEGAPLAVLGASVIIVLRSSLVPSTVRRTGLIGAAVLVGLFGLYQGGMHLQPLTTVWLVTGASGIVAATAVTSHVIYGLRREVNAARRLGQYELQRKLGEGGMGVVYEATHVMLRRPTAVKLLPIDKAGLRTVQRFEREVRQTSRLQHPNSVFIYDYGRTPDGQFYYAMEFLDGVDLEKLIEVGGPIPSARARNILLQAARALAEAHAMGLVHRDIKPANIMVCMRGGVPDTVKVVDFGLVKTPDEDGEVVDKLTNANTIMGTPHYLAPEGIRDAEGVGPPSDVYALGAVGYFLITGEEVFDGASIIEVCSKHLTEPPTPPSERSTGVDAGLEKVLLRCLEKEPADRFAEGGALADALEALSIDGWDAEAARTWWRNRADEKRDEAPAMPEPLAVDVTERL